MQDKFTVKNFRIFNEEGASFEFKPITLLTGQNGSGKSSLTKSVMLLHDFFVQGFKAQNDRRKKVFEPTRYYLDFSKPELKLGGFDSELNRNSNGDEMVFSYSVRPIVAPFAEFIVDYSFLSKKKDEFKRGWLSRIDIRWKNDRDEMTDVMKASVNEDGNLCVDFLNLNLKATLGSFLRFFFLVNLLYLKKQDSLCYDPDGDLINEERHNNLESRFNDLIALAEKHHFLFVESEVEGTKQLLRSLVADGVENVARLYPNLFESKLLKAMDTCLEKGVLFYFPLFDNLKDLNKEQTCDYLRGADFFFGRGKKDLKDKIILDFQKSEFDSFVDYFRDKEDHKLENVVNRCSVYIHLSDSDLIHRIGHEARVCFDASGPWGEDDGFNALYAFLSDWQWKLTPQGKDDYISRWVESDDLYSSSHLLYSAYLEYLGILIQEVVLPQSFANIHYIGNSHAGVKRLYSFDDKEDVFVTRIERYLNAKRDYEEAVSTHHLTPEQDGFVPGSFIDKWIVELGLGHSINMVVDEDSLGVKLFLRKHAEDRGIILADEGYGVNQIITLLICVETEILLLKTEEISNRETPIIGQPEPDPYVLSPVTVIIEEPEVNLHPAFQSKLADIFLEASSMFGNKIHFIIETHSEYLIRATQVYVAKQKYTDEEALNNLNPFVVYYLPKDGMPYDMEYTRSGRFVRKFGEGFFDAASSLNLELMKTEREK